MNTVTYDRHEESWDAHEDEQPDERLPLRPRRQFFNRRSAAVAALITCAVGFYAGVRVEKGQLAGTTSALSTGTGGASRAGGGAGLAGLLAGAGRAGGAGAGAAGAGAGAGGAGPGTAGAGAGTGAGGGPGGAGASFGTVASVNGKTLFVTETSGNTVKVRLSSNTKISKSQSVSRSAVRPGDTVIVTGVPGASGTVAAASVTDSGARSTGASGGSATGSGSSSSRSAVGSLFSPGG
jgi:hypothetical protein